MAVDFRDLRDGIKLVRLLRVPSVALLSELGSRTNSPFLFVPFSFLGTGHFHAVATHTLTFSLFSRTQPDSAHVWRGACCLDLEVSGGFGCSSGIGQSRRFPCTSSCKSWKLQMASHSLPRSENEPACDML